MFYRTNHKKSQLFNIWLNSLIELDRIFSGILRWQDLMDLATPSLISKVHNMQKDIEIDEAANIQFTSVIHLENT